MKRFCAANLPITLMASFFVAYLFFPSILFGAFPLSSQQLGNNGSTGVTGTGGTGGDGGVGGIRCTATLKNDAEDGTPGGKGGAGGNGGSGTWIINNMASGEFVSNNGTIVVGGIAGAGGSQGTEAAYSGGHGGDGGGYYGTGQNGNEPWDSDPDTSTQQGGSGASYVFWAFPPGGAGSDGGGGGGGSGGSIVAGDAGGAGGGGGNGTSGTGGTGVNGIAGTNASVTTTSSFANAVTSTLQVGGHGGSGGNGGQGGSGGGGGGGSGYCVVHTDPDLVGEGGYGGIKGDPGLGGNSGNGGTGILSLQENGRLQNNIGAVLEVNSNGQLTIEQSSSSLINNGTINNTPALNNNGLYGGTGIITNNFVNNSEFYPGDSLGKHTINGTYTENGQLLINISGIDESIPEYSQIQVGIQKLVTLNSISSVLKPHFTGTFDESQLNHDDYFDVIRFSPKWEVPNNGRPYDAYALTGTFNSVDESLSPLVYGFWDVEYNRDLGYVRIKYKVSPLVGTATDACDGTTISGASIQVESDTTQDTVVTNASGRYKFGTLSSGTYTILAQVAGYQDQIVEQVQISGYGDQIIQDMSLFPIDAADGDINNDCTVSLEDAIIVLQALGGISPQQSMHVTADINADNRVGLAEVIYILQQVAIH